MNRECFESHVHLALGNLKYSGPHPCNVISPTTFTPSQTASTMLCAICVSMFQKELGTECFPLSKGKHHASMADVEAAARQGCYLCSELILDYDYESLDDTSATPLSFELRLCDEARNNARLGHLSFESADGRLASGTYELVYTEHLSKPPGYDNFLQFAREDLLKEPWRVRNDGFLSSEEAFPESTGDPRVLKIAEGWLERCLEHHNKCENAEFSADAQWYPRRLLDLSGPGQRLILTEEEKLEERYATLSHCWGPNPAICCLTAENLHEMKQDIPTELLTKTFRDAVVATKMLKIRYLWIDSLCIMQSGTGSAEDWQEHAIAMRRIYTNALVNIGAARAASGSDGAFVLRTDTFLRPCHVLCKWPADFSQTVSADCFWTIRKSWRHQSHGVRTLPLYTRGWVVQERFLAPRVLHFARDRIFWECRELGLVEESFPGGFQDSCPWYESSVSWPFDLSDAAHEQSLPGEKDKIKTVSDPVWARWQEMINEYTGCDLSFPEKDILIALAGIAEKFGEHYDHQYVAGSFRQHLPFDLLWQNKGERSEEFRAPSWSWASIDGQVQFPDGDCPYCDECCNRFASVKDVRVELVNQEFIYGPVKRAELTLRGYLLPCSIEALARTGTGLRQRMKIYPGAQHDGLPLSSLHLSNNALFIISGEADIDDEGDSSRGFCSPTDFTAWVLPIMEFKEIPSYSFARHWGLLLKKNEDGEYVRLGIYRVREAFMDIIVEEQGLIQQNVLLV
jgi:hypothetical protein